MDNPNLRQDGQAFSLTAQSLSSAEKEYYTVLWQAACVEGDLLRGKAAFDFLSKSQLPREILKRIWDIADWQKRGLGWQEFVVTLKLISAAQKKQLVSLERVLETSGPTSRDLPTFDGIAAPPDGDAPEVPQKRDVFAEFEALAGVATSGTAPSLEILQVSPPTELVQEVEEPANHTGGNTSSSPPEVAHNDSQWDAFETPGASHGASAVPASAAPAHESQNWQAVGQTETAQKWDAFGDVQRQTENIHPEAAKETARPETDQEKWAAFGEDEAQASKPAQVEWNAFESEPATQQESWSAFGNEVQPNSKPEEESWAAFESASAPTSATAATASTTASTTAPTGDLWSKMSAFDDLLKEDDPVGAGGSAEMEQVPASASVDPETERPETTELKFQQVTLMTRMTSLATLQQGRAHHQRSLEIPFFQECKEQKGPMWKTWTSWTSVQQCLRQRALCLALPLSEVLTLSMTLQLQWLVKDQSQLRHPLQHLTQILVSLAEKLQPKHSRQDFLILEVSLGTLVAAAAAQPRMWLHCLQYRLSQVPTLHLLMFGQHFPSKDLLPPLSRSRAQAAKPGMPSVMEEVELHRVMAVKVGHPSERLIFPYSQPLEVLQILERRQI